MTFVGAWVSPQRTETGSHLRRCASDPKAESPSRAVTCLPLVRRGNATWACTMAPWSWSTVALHAPLTGAGPASLDLEINRHLLW